MLLLIANLSLQWVCKKKKQFNANCKCLHVCASFLLNWFPLFSSPLSLQLWSSSATTPGSSPRRSASCGWWRIEASTRSTETLTTTSARCWKLWGRPWSARSTREPPRPHCCALFWPFLDVGSLWTYWWEGGVMKLIGWTEWRENPYANHGCLIKLYYYQESSVVWLDFCVKSVAHVLLCCTCVKESWCLIVTLRPKMNPLLSPL